MSRFGVLVGRNEAQRPWGALKCIRNSRRPVWPLVVSQERIEGKGLSSSLELEQSLVNHIRANTLTALESSLRVCAGE